MTVEQLAKRFVTNRATEFDFYLWMSDLKKNMHRDCERDPWVTVTSACVGTEREYTVWHWIWRLNSTVITEYRTWRGTCSMTLNVSVAADKEFLMKQRNLLRLFHRVTQYNFFKDQVEEGTNFDIEAQIGNFKVRVTIELRCADTLYSKIQIENCNLG